MLFGDMDGEKGERVSETSTALQRVMDDRCRFRG